MTVTTIELPKTARKARFDAGTVAEAAKQVKAGKVASPSNDDGTPMTWSRKNAQQAAFDLRRAVAERLGIDTADVSSRTFPIAEGSDEYAFGVYRKS